MKNIILSVGLLITVFSLSGCGKIGPKFQAESGEEYYISKQGDGEYGFSAPATDLTNVREKGTRVHSEKVKRKNLKNQLIAAAKYTKSLGYNYFAVTNINISNLNGFPINNYNDLARYITLSERKSNFATNGTARDYRGLIGNGTYPEMLLMFAPISNKLATSGAISAWKVSDFVR